LTVRLRGQWLDLLCLQAVLIGAGLRDALHHNVCQCAWPHVQFPAPTASLLEQSGGQCSHANCANLCHCTVHACSHNLTDLPDGVAVGCELDTNIRVPCWRRCCQFQGAGSIVELPILTTRLHTTGLLTAGSVSRIAWSLGPGRCRGADHSARRERHKRGKAVYSRGCAHAAGLSCACTWCAGGQGTAR
jgi:hypothetical protein